VSALSIQADPEDNYPPITNHKPMSGKAVQAIFTDSAGRSQRAKNTQYTNSSNQPVFVQLEIQLDAFQRLINDHQLVAEDLHCLNNQSQRILKSALLRSLLGSNQILGA